MVLSIRKKILTAFLTLIAFFLTLVAVAGVYNQALAYKTLTMVGSVQAEMAALSSLGDVMEQALMSANDHIITGDRRYEAAFKNESEMVERLLTKMEKALASNAEHAPQAVKEEREILRDVRVSWKNINAIAMKIFAIRRPVGSPVAAGLMEEMDYKWGRPAAKRLARLHEIGTGNLKDAIGKINAALMRSGLITGAALAILTVVGVFLASYYSKKIVIPIRDLCGGAERIAGGDFDFRVDVRTGDEIEQLANRFNAMGERLRESYSMLEERVKERTKELQCERDKLINVFSVMEDGVYIVNKDYDIEYINPSLEREFGPWQERKCYEYFHNRVEVCPWCPNQEVFKGKTVRWEWHSVKNGKTYDLLDTLLKNPDGTLSKLEIFRDISEKVRAQRALKESEEKYRLMIEESNDLIWVQDASGAISFMNRRCEEVGGYSFEEVKGSIVDPYIVEEDLPNVRRAFQKVMSGERVSYEARGMKKDGGVLFLLINAAPLIKDGMVKGKVSFGCDITEERRVTAELKDRVDELERFVKVAIDRELRMKDLADEIERLKNTGI